MDVVLTAKEIQVLERIKYLKQLEIGSVLVWILLNKLSDDLNSEAFIQVSY